MTKKLRLEERLPRAISEAIRYVHLLVKLLYSHEHARLNAISLVTVREKRVNHGWCCVCWCVCGFGHANEQKAT